MTACGVMRLHSKLRSYQLYGGSAPGSSQADRPPNKRLPQHARVAAERAAARKRWRLRQTNRAREAATLAAERDAAAGGDVVA